LPLSFAALTWPATVAGSVKDGTRVPTDRPAVFFAAGFARFADFAVGLAFETFFAAFFLTIRAMVPSSLVEKLAQKSHIPLHCQAYPRILRQLHFD
jgi:hypothetical protein